MENEVATPIKCAYHFCKNEIPADKAVTGRIYARNILGRPVRGEPNVKRFCSQQCATNEQCASEG